MRPPITTALVLAALTGCSPDRPPATGADAAPRTQKTQAEPVDPSDPTTGGALLVAQAEVTTSGKHPEAVASDSAAAMLDLPTETPADLGGAEPSAPEDYGVLQFPDPIPARESLVIHAVAGYEVVSVYSKPDTESPKLGYLRIGTRLKVGEKVEGTGCAKGFYPLPTGGYACASKGLVVASDKAPFMSYEPPPPRVDQALPYDYGYVRKWNAPMFWRVPNAKELEEAASQRAVRESERTGVPLPSAGGDTDTDGDTDGAEPAEPPEPIKLPLSPAEPWLEKGYFLSLAEKLHEEGRMFWRTARGAVVSAGDVYGYTAKDFQGHELTEEMDFPFGYVNKKSTRLFELAEDGKLKVKGNLEKRDFIDLSEETEVKGKAYMLTTEGLLVRKDDLLLADPQPLPKGLDPWDRWIDVSLDQQLLVAYEGSKPVYTTLVSSGKKNKAEETFETPKGRYRVSSKHISTTMDGGTASDGNYSIQDVPWTMFFQGSYALHGAFWHRSFGRQRSHGCVNLGPSDARWLFNWTTPILPSGWHGVNATDETPGTTIVIRD
ncbi:MAG: L,D-transpeptidase family protein [Myxococcales bacterium]|nr:L,D-transpeptidase family protein [Myxococcales bacterium]